jgi:hypothetical protein
VAISRKGILKIQGNPRARKDTFPGQALCCFHNGLLITASPPLYAASKFVLLLDGGAGVDEKKVCLHYDFSLKPPAAKKVCCISFLRI